MNCEECKELLVAYIEGFLDESQKQAVAEHLNDCRNCRAEVKELTNLHDRLVKNGNALALKNLEDDVMNQIMREQNIKLKAAHRAGVGLKLRRIIMKSKVARLAAAAVIIIAMLVGIYHFGSPIESVAWAEVLDNIKRAPAFSYLMKLDMKGVAGIQGDGTMKLEIEGLISQDYGMRMNTHIDDRLAAQVYVLPAQGLLISVVPEEKQYVRMTLTDELLEKVQKDNGDPRKMVEEFMKYEYTELGRNTIDGIEVEGIESKDPKIAGGILGDVTGRLWCAVENGLPVRLEVEAYSEDGTRVMDMAQYGFTWDLDVDIAEFEPNIPDDYKLAAELELSGGEKSVVQGLQFFAELTDGRYPSELSPLIMAQELRKLQGAMTKQFGDSADENTRQEVMQKLVNLQMVGTFYATLVNEDKDPAYYGDKVTDEFPHAVLMRWKTDNGNYKVIFADLTVDEVSPEELAELESAPLNSEPIAIKPYPADGAGGLRLSELQLSWMPGAYVTKHKVYFGTNADSLTLLTEVSDSCSVPALALQRQMSYYWRVDEIQPDGSIATGDVWSFDTGRQVGWWKLDDSTDDIAVDWSDNGNDGNLVGDANLVPGIIGGALQFDGDGDYVDIGDSPALNITNQITVSAWIKVDTFDSNYQAIITKGDSAWRLQRDEGNNNLEFACSGVDVPGAEWSGIFGTKDVNDGQWHHAVGVYDGNMMCLYVDGELDVSSEASGTIQINNKPVYIGENAERPGRCWNGLIDDVQVYNYALTSDEIAIIYEERTAFLGY